MALGVRVLQSISQYEIRRKVGEGGMGVVFEGWDGRLGRRVAIKTLRHATENEDARNRMWSEARSLARVSHPRVCQIYDVLEQGRDIFLVLEFLEGRSLADRLAAGAIPVAEAISIEQQVLEALDALHALGKDLRRPADCVQVRAAVLFARFPPARATVADDRAAIDWGNRDAIQRRVQRQWYYSRPFGDLSCASERTPIPDRLTSLHQGDRFE